MPKTVNLKDRRLKIVRIMVNEAEYKALKKGQKQANYSTLADYIRTTTIKQNNALNGSINKSNKLTNVTCKKD